MSSNENLLVENYGFKLQDTFNPADIKQFQESYKVILDNRLRRWNEVMNNGKLPLLNKQNNAQLSCFNSPDIVPYSTLKRFVRKGIPSTYRPEAWFIYSGANEDYEQNKGKYDLWCNGTIDEANKTTISVDRKSIEYNLKGIKFDVPRTFPENPKFNESNPETLQEPLRRILTAFVYKNPTIGYCQGMNFIAGLILLVMMPDEEKAFFVFNRLVTKILQSYYLPGMVRVQVDCMVFQELIRIKMPLVHLSITDRCNASTIVVCTKWFLCAFVDVLPIQTSLRVMDCVLCEGDKILFRAALAIIRLNNIEIMRCESIGDLMNLFKSIFSSKSVLFCHEFIDCMFSSIGSLSQKKVNALRQTAEKSLNDANSK